MLVVGPDGVGKTTVRHALAESAPPGITIETDRRAMLPRWTKGAVTEPHRQEPYPTQLSIAKTFYYFADALLNWVLWVRPAIRKGVWLVRERGWWDMAVDPRRYRLRPHPRLFRFLGRLLPRPDLILVLEGSPAMVWARKPELTKEEIARQARAWHTELPSWQRRVYLDVALPLDEVIRQASREIEEVVEGTSSGRTPGWTGLPSRDTPRWTMPRAPRRVAKSALRVYHPVTVRGYGGWVAARVFASVGGFRLLPAGPVPTKEILDTVRPYAAGAASIALARTNHHGRYIALLLGSRGEGRGIAKIATDESGRVALKREAEATALYGSLLPDPLSAPRILDCGEGVLLFEVVDWQPRLRSWRIPEDVASALGRFFSAGKSGDGGPATNRCVGLAHGDFAPWNLLETHRRWVLIDWDDAHAGAPPFYDIFHYLVQSTTLLGRPSRRALMLGLEGNGWVGRAVAAYASGAGVAIAEAPRHLESYLEESARRVDLATREGPMSLEFRKDLLAHIRSGQVER